MYVFFRFQKELGCWFYAYSHWKRKAYSVALIQELFRCFWELYLSLPIFKLEFSWVNDVTRKGFHLKGALSYLNSILNCFSLPFSRGFTLLWFTWTQKAKGKIFHCEWVNSESVSELLLKTNLASSQQTKL